MRWIGLWLHWATENHLVSLILFKITCLIGLSLFVHTLAGGIYHVKTEVYLHSTSAFLRPSVSICVHLHPMYAHLQQVDGLLDRDVSQCSFPHHSEKRAKKDEDPDRETECLHQIYSASIDRIQREIDRLQIPRRIAVQVDYQYNVSVTYVDEYLLDNFYCIRIQLGRGDLYDVIEFYVHPSTADLANHTSDSNAETFYPSANHTKVNNTKEDDINPSQPKVSIDLLETLWLRNPLLRVYLSEYNTFPTYQSLTFYESSKLDVMMDALHIRCTALPAPYATNCNEYGPITLLPKNDQKSWNQDEREQMQQNKNRSTMNDVRYVHLNTLQDTYTIKQGDVVEQCMKYEDPTQEYSFLRTLLQHQPIQIQTKSDGIRSADQCERQYRQINCVYDLFLNDRGEQIMSNRYRSSSLDIRIKIIKPIIEYRTTKRMAIQLFFIYIGYSLCFWFGLDFVSYVQILRRVVCRLLPNRAQLHRNIIGVLQITFMIIASVAVTLNSWTLVGDYVDRKTFPMSNVYIQRQIEMNAFSVCFDPVQIRTVHSFHNESSCSKFAFDEALKKSIELEPGQERINNISRTPADPRDGIIISDTRKLRQRTSLPLLTKQSVANKRCSNELKSMPLQEMLSRTKPFEKLIDEITIWNDQYNSETLRPPDLKRKLKARQVSISLYTKAGAKCYQLRNDRPQTMNRDLLPFTDGQRLHVQSSHQFYMYMHEWNKKARHRHQYFSGFQTYYLEYNRRLLQHPFRPSCRNYEQSRYESQVHCIEVCVLRFYLLVLHMLPAYITIDLPENNLQSYYPRYKNVASIRCTKRLETIVNARFVLLNHTHVKQIPLTAIERSTNNSMMFESVHYLRNETFFRSVIKQLQSTIYNRIPRSCMFHQMSLPSQNQRYFLWGVFSECEKQCPHFDCQLKSYYAYLLSENSNGEMRVMLSPLYRDNRYQPRVRLFDLLFLFPSLANFWFGFSVHRVGRSLLTNKRIQSMLQRKAGILIKSGTMEWRLLNGKFRFGYLIIWMFLLISMSVHLHYVILDYNSNNEIVRQYFKRTQEINAPAVSVCLPLKGILKQVLLHQLLTLERQLVREQNNQGEPSLPWCRHPSTFEKVPSAVQYVRDMIQKVHRHQVRHDSGENELLRMLKPYHLPYLTYSYRELFDSVRFVTPHKRIFMLWLRPEARKSTINNQSDIFELIFDPLPNQIHGSVESFRVVSETRPFVETDQGEMLGKLPHTRCLLHSKWNATHLSLCGLRMTLFWFRQMVCVKNELNFRLRTFEMQVKDQLLLDVKLNHRLPIQSIEQFDKRDTFGVSFVHERHELPAENWQYNLAGYSNLFKYRKYVFVHRDQAVSRCSSHSRLNHVRQCFVNKFLNRYDSCSLLVPITANTCPNSAPLNGSVMLDEEQRQWIEQCGSKEEHQCLQQYFKIKVQYGRNGQGVKSNEDDETDENSRWQKSLREKGIAIIVKQPENGSSVESETRVQITSEWIETIVEYFPKTQQFELLLTVGTVLSIWLNIGFLHLLQFGRLSIKWLTIKFCITPESGTNQANDEKSQRQTIRWTNQDLQQMIDQRIRRNVVYSSATHMLTNMLSSEWTPARSQINGRCDCELSIDWNLNQCHQCRPSQSDSIPIKRVNPWFKVNERHNFD